MLEHGTIHNTQAKRLNNKIPLLESQQNLYANQKQTKSRHLSPMHVLELGPTI